MIDLDSKTCTYAGGAHPDIVLWRHQQNEFTRLASQNSIIGFEQKNENQFIQDEINIESGDKIVLYTDGLIDIEDDNNKPVGVNGLINSLQQLIGLSSYEIPEKLVTAIGNNSKRNIRDDIFLIAVELK
jgi:sigma-B regulation protein RsbU (phosphoserine phosphatase)